MANKIVLNYIKDRMDINQWKPNKFRVESQLGATTTLSFTNEKRNNMNYLDVRWKFLLFTNLQDVWVFPYEFIKRKDKLIIGSDYTKPFKNNFDLLDAKHYDIILFLLHNHLVNQ